MTFTTAWETDEEIHARTGLPIQVVRDLAAGLLRKGMLDARVHRFDGRVSVEYRLRDVPKEATA